MYAEDKTNFGVCDNSVYDSKECFLQILTITRQKTKTPTSEYFEDNYAYISASSIFGGLLDRCTVRDSTNIHYSRIIHCLLYTSPSPRDATLSRMPSSA